MTVDGHPHWTPISILMVKFWLDLATSPTKYGLSEAKSRLCLEGLQQRLFIANSTTCLSSAQLNLLFLHVGCYLLFEGSRDHL
jgi:hypothetical protein